MKISMRSCVACKNSFPKSELVRFVRVSSDRIVVDKSRKLSGRGAYLCASEQCFAKARKQSSLQRHLKVALSDVDFDRLAQDFAKEAELVESLSVLKTESV